MLTLDTPRECKSFFMGGYSVIGLPNCNKLKVIAICTSFCFGRAPAPTRVWILPISNAGNDPSSCLCTKFQSQRHSSFLTRGFQKLDNNSISNCLGRPSKLLLPPLEGAPTVVWDPLIPTSTKSQGVGKGLGEEEESLHLRMFCWAQLKPLQRSIIPPWE